MPPAGRRTGAMRPSPHAHLLGQRRSAVLQAGITLWGEQNVSPCEDSQPIMSPCTTCVSLPHPQLGTRDGPRGQEGSKIPRSMQNHLSLRLLLSQKLTTTTKLTNAHGKHGWERLGPAWCKIQAGTWPHATFRPPGSTLGARRTPHSPTHPQIKYHLGFAVADKLIGILGVKNDKILKLRGESRINAKLSDVPCFILSGKTSAFIQAHQTERGGPGPCGAHLEPKFRPQLCAAHRALGVRRPPPQANFLSQGGNQETFVAS